MRLSIIHYTNKTEKLGENTVEAQKTEIGYQSFQDSKEYYIDEDFIEENPDCWKIINFISDNPFSTQE